MLRDRLNLTKNYEWLRQKNTKASVAFVCSKLSRLSSWTKDISWRKSFRKILFSKVSLWTKLLRPQRGLLLRNREVSRSSVKSSNVQIGPRVHVDIDRRVVVACDCFSRQRWWTTNHWGAAGEAALELSDRLQCVLLVPALQHCARWEWKALVWPWAHPLHPRHHHRRRGSHDHQANHNQVAQHGLHHSLASL